MRFTTLLDYHLIDRRWNLNFVCLLVLFIGFYYSNLIWKTGKFKQASTITLVLQANRLTKYARHSEYKFQMKQFPTVFP